MTAGNTRGHGSKLGRQREQLIASLLGARTVEEAAQRVGLSKATALRWMKQDAFRPAFGAARRELLSATVGRLQAVSGEAVEALRAAVTSASPSTVSVSAARAILDFAAKGVELLDLEERVAALEERFAADDSPKGGS
jgi:transposase-like protein